MLGPQGPCILVPKVMHDIHVVSHMIFMWDEPQDALSQAWLEVLGPPKGKQDL